MRKHYLPGSVFSAHGREVMYFHPRPKDGLSLCAIVYCYYVPLYCITELCQCSCAIAVQREKCLVVLNHLLCYESQDALLLGCQFRCLQSGLVFFLEYDQQVFQSYIQKVNFPVHTKET